MSFDAKSVKNHFIILVVCFTILGVSAYVEKTAAVNRQLSSTDYQERTQDSSRTYETDKKFIREN